MAERQFRHEYKHPINLLDYHALRQRLRPLARPDPHGDEQGRYHIRSLYFDNDEDKALREKINGLPQREKYRIRIYNHSDARILLEKKSKHGGLSSKQSALLTRSEADRILNGDLAWLAHTRHPILAEFYGKLRTHRLRPKTVVDYMREAYTYPHGNVRITFDSHLRTGLYATDLFNPSLPTLPVGEPGVLLLEVKYDHFLPDLMRDLIQTNTRQTTAFSKYAAARIYG